MKVIDEISHGDIFIEQNAIHRNSPLYPGEYKRATGTPAMIYTANGKLHKYQFPTVNNYGVPAPASLN